MQQMILTFKELQKAYQYALEKGHKNVVIQGEGCGGIGYLVHICEQDNWLENRECEKTDITDYEAW